MVAPREAAAMRRDACKCNTLRNQINSRDYKGRCGYLWEGRELSICKSLSKGQAKHGSGTAVDRPGPAKLKLETRTRGRKQREMNIWLQ